MIALYPPASAGLLLPRRRPRPGLEVRALLREVRVRVDALDRRCDGLGAWVDVVGTPLRGARP